MHVLFDAVLSCANTADSRGTVNVSFYTPEESVVRLLDVDVNEVPRLKLQLKNRAVNCVEIGVVGV